MFLWPYILFLHKESYLTILMFLDYSIVTECFFNYRPRILHVLFCREPGRAVMKINREYEM